MNSSPGSSDHFGPTTMLGTLMGNFFASGAMTFSGSRAVTFLPKRSCVSNLAR